MPKAVSRGHDVLGNVYLVPFVWCSCGWSCSRADVVAAQAAAAVHALMHAPRTTTKAMVVNHHTDGEDAA